MAELEEEIEKYASERSTKKYSNIQSRLVKITKEMKGLQPTSPANIALREKYNDRLTQLWKEFESRSDSLVEVLEQQMEGVVVEASGKSSSQRNHELRKDAIEIYKQEIPYPEYVNQKEKIDWINQEIKILNVRNDAFVYPGFHTYGVRKLTRNHFDRNGKLHEIPAKSHRWEHWREAEPGRMLHLRNDRRFKMGTALTNYFTFNTSTCNNSDSWLCWWEGRNDRSRG